MIKHDGAWRSFAGYVKADGVWRFTEIYIKNNGAWVTPNDEFNWYDYYFDLDNYP